MHQPAAAAVIWRPEIEAPDGSLSHNDTLFVMGGFGGWPESDSRHNGMRCRNDVYKTKDGGERLDTEITCTTCAIPYVASSRRVFFELLSTFLVPINRCIL